MASRRYLMVALVLAATACGSPATTSTTRDPTTTTAAGPSTTPSPHPETRTVQTPEGIPIDVHVPATTGRRPVALLLHGSPPNTKEDVSVFADLIAEETGAVVYNVGWTEGGMEGVDGSVRNVACAVAYARDTADYYGGDASRITVVGMSAGGWSGAAAALGGERLATDCSGDSSPLPEAFVGIAGAYSAAVDGPVADMLASDPEALRASDPYTYLGQNPALRLWLVHGDSDTAVPISVSEAFRDALAADGYDVGLVVLADTGHPGDSVLTPDNQRKVLSTIESAAESP